MEQKIKQDEIHIGQNIRRIRKEKGMRQTEMGGIDAVRECAADKGSISEDRKRNTAYTSITA